MSRNNAQCEKFIIRFIEPGLRQQIADLARQSNRSMNAEILHRLFHSAQLEEQLARANAIIDRLIAQSDREERP
jgi:hypothetical protein